MKRVTWLLLATLAIACQRPSEGSGQDNQLANADEGSAKNDGDPSADGEESQQTPSTLVEVITVESGSIARGLQTSASVKAEAMAEIKPQVTGMVTEVRKRIGDPVKRGDVLAVIDNVSVDASARRSSDEVNYLQAKYDELAALYEKGAVSQSELNDAAHQLRTAKTSMREANANKRETRLIAPFSGDVADAMLTVGSQAQVGVTAFTIVDLSVLRIDATLPERDMAMVHLDQPAEVTAAYDTSVTSAARVSRISPVVDPVSGTFKVELTIEDPETELRPGQFVSARIETERHDNALSVPKRALVYEAGTPHVFVVGPQTDEAPTLTATLTPISLGIDTPTDAEVLSGLNEGDRVVFIGQDNLADGAPVRIAENTEEEQL